MIGWTERDRLTLRRLTDPALIRAAVRVAVSAALIVGASSAPALAQAYQCRMPERIDLPSPVRPDGPTVRTPIAGYTLALSWSPEYCRSAGRGRGDAAIQCGGGNGRFGLILHGLWPEARIGQSPQWCATTPRPGGQLLRQNLCMTPSPRLLEREWAKHGSCMARTPEGYFKVAGILWRSLRFPDLDRLSREPGLTAGDLRREWAQANPDWPAAAIGIETGRNGWLRELRLCYSRAFLPSPCPRRGFGVPDRAPLKIWRGL